MPTEAAPIKISTSGKFLGNDGAWSTFLIRAGTPEQELEVLPSTEVPETWLVLPKGCDVKNDAANCTQARGGAFNNSISSSWSPKDTYLLTSEARLGYSAPTDSGLYGFDTLGVGVPGQGNVTLEHQVVAGITTKDFFLGSLGLHQRPISFPDQTTAPSLITYLKANSLIPSLSYGYTAGASYHQTEGSLTLGGYDATRFIPSNVSFSLGTTDITRQLTVQLRSIMSTDSQGSKTSLMTSRFLALADSTVPQIWLPLDVCRAFEATFGLQFDPISNLYKVNDTLHDSLVKQNPSIVFELGDQKGSGPSVNITMPYSSFDLQAGPPKFQNLTRYFPIRQTPDESQYTLGRAFFQEAYLLVDYSKFNFSFSQALFPTGSSSRIIAITDANPTPSSANPSTSSTNLKPASHSSHSIGAGAIAGIVVAIILIALIVAGLFLFFRRRRRRTQYSAKVELPANPPPPRDKAELEAHAASVPPEKGGPSEGLEEKIDQDPLDQAETSLMDHAGKHGNTPAAELGAANEVGIPEMPGHPPAAEMPSPDPGVIRSELSTPDPEYSRAEMPSDGGERSPPSDGNPSPLSAGEFFWARTHGSRSRTGPRANVTSPNRQPSGDSDMLISPQVSAASPQSSRPPHRRLNSEDSWETRLEMSAPGSPFSPLSAKSNHDHPVQAMPSIGPGDSVSDLGSTSVGSLRSALHSPEPLGTHEHEQEQGRKP